MTKFESPEQVIDVIDGMGIDAQSLVEQLTNRALDVAGALALVIDGYTFFKGRVETGLASYEDFFKAMEGVLLVPQVVCDGLMTTNDPNTDPVLQRMVQYKHEITNAMLDIELKKLSEDLND